MPERSCLYIWNVLCCSSCNINERKCSKCCNPSTKKQKRTITLSELSRKRQFIINELVETEQRYVEQLNTLHSEFMLPLFKLESNCDPLGKLCTQIKLFLRYHRVLLSDLLKGKSIPSVFNKTGFFFELTWDYMNLYPEVCSIIETISHKSKKFRELIKNNELVYQVQLSQLLLEPVKRIPRYKLQLQDLLASTPKGHPEFNNLEKALKKIGTILLKLKEARDSDSSDTMWNIYQRIKGRGASLWSPTRKFVRKDVFWCVFQSEHFHFFPPSRVRAFLFSTCIIICEDQKVGRSYKFLDEISFSVISSMEFVQDPHISFKRHQMSTDVLGFELSANGHGTFELYHSNHAVLKKWFEMINKLRTRNTMMGTKREPLKYGRATARIYPNLLFRKRRTTSTIVGSMTIPEVASSYGSVSNYEPSSKGNSDHASTEPSGSKSLSTSESVNTVIVHSTECSCSSTESDSRRIYQTTSMLENLWELTRRRSGNYIMVSDSKERKLSVRRA